MAKHLSRAAVRRQRETLLDSRVHRDPLPAELAARAERFVPVSLEETDWLVVRPLFLAVVATCPTRGVDAFSKRCVALAGFLVWCALEGHDLTILSAMRFELIEAYISVTGRSASCRSHLRSLARSANPAGVPPAPATMPHDPVRAPYTAVEMAAIERLALTQPTAVQRRALCAVVGLGRGAGLDSQDFRNLFESHVVDRGDDGIWVEVQAPRPRLVPVRRAYEPLVRAGLDGLSASQLVIGLSSTRRNIAGKVVERSTILGNAPRIEAGRLRTTWLADLLTSDVPLVVVMAVSGLTSARTLTEIVAHLDGDTNRGVAR